VTAYALAHPYLAFWLAVLLLGSIRLSLTWGGKSEAKFLAEAIASLEAARSEASKLHGEAQYGSGLQCRYAGEISAYGRAVEVLRALQVRALGFISGGDTP